MNIIKKTRWLASLPAKLREASLQSGKSRATLLGEILALYRQAEQFGIDDYFDYRVFANDWRGEQRAVAGWRMLYWLDDKLNPKAWRNLAYDKLVMYALMHTAGLPLARTLAVYQRHGRGFLDAAQFTTAEQLAAALRGNFPYPCFAKPVYGDVGAGTVAILAYEQQSDSLRLSNGELRPLPVFIESLAARRQFAQPVFGHLFQQLLTLHPSLQPYCGQRIASVRLVVLMHDEGPEVISASWKIIVGNNMGDNYDHGRSGNLWASVELDSGRVERIVHGSGLQQKRYRHHPDNGLPLEDLVLPDWQAALALAKRGARVFPMLRFQHWDIALTDEGPKVLEVNVTGGIDIVQYGAGRGLYDDKLRAFVARYGAA